MMADCELLLLYCGGRGAFGIVNHLRRRSATADSSCGEFARFKSTIGRTRWGEMGAHFLDLRSLFVRDKQRAAQSPSPIRLAEPSSFTANRVLPE